MDTLNKLKDKRLPQVINEAVEILKHLTDGRYTMINYNQDSITVKHVNGQLYHPVELSQSTKELLYVALRISLIKGTKTILSVPINRR